MKTKSFEGLKGQLSRTQMKAITAGRPYDPNDPGCGSLCRCSDGTRAQFDGGSHCFCVTGSIACQPPLE